MNEITITPQLQDIIRKNTYKKVDISDLYVAQYVKRSNDVNELVSMTSGCYYVVQLKDNKLYLLTHDKFNRYKNNTNLIHVTNDERFILYKIANINNYNINLYKYNFYYDVLQNKMYRYNLYNHAHENIKINDENIKTNDENIKTNDEYSFIHHTITYKPHNVDVNIGLNNEYLLL